MDTIPRQPDESADSRAFWISSLIYLALSLLMGAVSKGFLEGDACTHYLYARFAFAEPYLLVDVWGRPFCTAIYAVPAFLFGLMGVRALCAILVVVIGFLCRRVAKNLGFQRPALAAILLYAQPLLFLHSFSELTEIPFMFLLALALFAFERRKWKTFALIIGLMPTARPEGFGFILLAVLALLWTNRKAIPLLFLPLVLWSVVGWVDYGALQPWYIEAPLWLKRNWPYSEKSVYEPKNFFFLPSMLPGVLGPLLFIGLPLGVWQCLRRYPFTFENRVKYAIATTALMVLVGHAALGALGKLGSNAELRYLLTVSPLWAMTMAVGWNWVFDRYPFKRKYLLVGALALAPLVVNFGYYRVFPLGLNSEGKRSEEVARWLKTRPFAGDYDKTIYTVRGLNYLMDVSHTDPAKSAEYKRNRILPDIRGVLMVWDPIYGQYNSDANRILSAEEIAEKGWIPVKIFNNTQSIQKKTGLLDQLSKDELKEWVVFLSPLTKDGRKTDESLRVPLPSTTSKK